MTPRLSGFIVCAICGQLTPRRRRALTCAGECRREYKRRYAQILRSCGQFCMPDKPLAMIIVCGYIPTDGVEEADYQDYLRRPQRLDVLEYDLQSGNLPPGLLLWDGNRKMVVTGRTGEPQSLNLLPPVGLM